MSPGTTDTVEEAEDACALPLARRVAAMLDLDPVDLREGDRLPRGWHVALFTVATPHSALRPDGLAGLGVTLPDLGFPRIMAAGKRTRFLGDITIGEPVRRRSRTASVSHKEGRSGRFVIVTVEHRIFASGGEEPVLVEEQDYVMREAAPEAAGPPVATLAPDPPRARADAAIQREVVPDEALLLRYCAVTFNTHRIHYDYPYATGVEGYPALVVNGGLPVLMLVELFRRESGRQPASVAGRNLGPLYCGRFMRLCATPGRDATPGSDAWRLWAEDDAGQAAIELSVR